MRAGRSRARVGRRSSCALRKVASEEASDSYMMAATRSTADDNFRSPRGVIMRVVTKKVIADEMFVNSEKLEPLCRPGSKNLQLEAKKGGGEAAKGRDEKGKGGKASTSAKG